MNLIEVMKQALEALDYIYATSDDQQEKKTDAISALRAAIEAAKKSSPIRSRRRNRVITHTTQTSRRTGRIRVEEHQHA